PELRDITADIMTPTQITQAQELSAQLQQEISRSSAPPDVKDPSPKIFGIPDRQIKGSGTGFIITKDGYVLTCQHVVDNAESIEVAIEDNVYPAKLIREDRYNDLALLKISGTFQPLAFSAKRSAQMGQEVFTIGYPNPVLQGISAKLTKGTVASLAGIQDDLRLYQISVPVQPGNSGGALLDLDGNILGVIVAILDAKTAFDISGSLPQNVNYAVKGAYALALLDTLPGVSEKLPPPYGEQPFADVVNRVSKSVGMVLIY
ncbi:MAG: trypsin-like peptidase domain-containing protein, partial [Candidatus Moranbacteria bacterium]|nr:trypsin-like peptidase domain-containing protein [Candidatus Moranbacteria bacterium]